MGPARWTADDLPDLAGRVALVTGANAGLGLAVTRALASRGCRVLLACRSATRAEDAVAGIRLRQPDAALAVRVVDLADLPSVAALAQRLEAEEDRLDLLVNNAGVMAVDHRTTSQGVDLQLAVNHLGHFALTLRVLPLLAAAPAARVVTVSSIAHRVGRIDPCDPCREGRRPGRWEAYSASKLANLLFTAELDRRLAAAASPVVALAAHPGFARTELGAGGTAPSNAVVRAFGPLVSQPAERAALPVLRAATDPAAPRGGYFGPRWLVRGRAVPERPARRARGATAARRLWDASERLTGVVAADVLGPAAP